MTELTRHQNAYRTILDSSKHGFVTFGRDLKIDPDYSKRAGEFLGTELKGKNICEILHLNHETFTEFANLVFQEKDWQEKNLEILERLPSMESKVAGRILKVEFSPIVGEKKITRILATLTDVTALKKLEQRSEEVERDTRAIIKILQSKPVFRELLRLVNELPDGRYPDDEANNKFNHEATAKRQVHTLKGEFSFFECQDLVKLCNFWEEKWTAGYCSGDFALFLNQFRSTLSSFLSRYKNLLKIESTPRTEMTVSLSRIKDLVAEIAELKISHCLFTKIEAMVERPIEECLEWLGETWLMVASSLGKSVNPIVWKKSVPVFEEPYKKLFFSLVHAVRNSADHGIESPQERLAAGKPEKGSLVGEFELVGEIYHLRLTDDGKGVGGKGDTKAALPAKVQKKSSISGRGIGLSAIRAEARALEGDVEVSGVAGSGSGFELHIWFKKIPVINAIAVIAID